jgi:hypothetical protein
VEAESDIAAGILSLGVERGTTFDLGEIAALEPTYLRAVAAKTIAERKQGA